MAAAGLQKQYEWILGYRDVPFAIVRNGLRITVARHLNPRIRDCVGPRNVSPDWMGLADLLELDQWEIQNLESKHSPCEELLKIVPKVTKLTTFLEFIAELERYDVLDEIKVNADRDAETYRTRKSREMLQAVQDEEVTTSSKDELSNVVIGDEEDNPRTFDAYVSYCGSKKSQEFVKLLINELEKRPDGQRPLELFIPGRDQLIGAAQFVITAHIIEARCKRMLVLLDKDYLDSEHCDFQLKFAQALSPGARTKRIIPIVIEEGVKVPSILKFVTLCDWTREDLHTWFWERLYQSIKPKVVRGAEQGATSLRNIAVSLPSLGSFSSSTS